MPRLRQSRPSAARPPREVQEAGGGGGRPRILVISEGGDPSTEMVVLKRCMVQFGMYRGQTPKWLLENNVGWVLATRRSKSAASPKYHLRPTRRPWPAMQTPTLMSWRKSGSAVHSWTPEFGPPSPNRRARPLLASIDTGGRHCRTCMSPRTRSGEICHFPKSVILV